MRLEAQLAEAFAILDDMGVSKRGGRGSGREGLASTCDVHPHILKFFTLQVSVQQSRLSSQFVFQCCNLLNIQKNLPFHLNLNFNLQSTLRCSKWVSSGE